MRKRILKGSSGFTLIETLVAINLLFLAVTLVISFYLFSSRFILSISSGMQENQNIMDFILKTEEILDKSSSFTVILSEDTLLINTQDQKYILFIKEKADLDNYLVVKDPEELTVNIELFKNTFIQFEPAKGNLAFSGTLNFRDNKSIIRSEEIKKFSVSFIKKNRTQGFTFNAPAESVKRFQNINR